jgi:TatD DNase family protein
LIDTHAHLTDGAFGGDVAGVIERARALGVEIILDVADAPEGWERTLGLCAEFPVVRAALGLHPCFADRFSPLVAERLCREASRPEVVAAGEIGLDYARCPIPSSSQIAAFIGMLEAAESAGLPVIIHCRDAFGDLFETLDRFYGKRPAGCPRGVLHCFSGGREEAAMGLRLGFLLGADGPVTYPKNHGLRAALGEAGLGGIVLETDSPYLPPQSSRGKRNEPSSVVEVAAALARIFSKTPEEVAAETSRNAREVFRLG